MHGRNNRAIPYSDAELQWVEDNQEGISRKELAEKFNAEFDRTLSGDNLGGLCKRKGWNNGLDTRFHEDQVSWNKGTKGLTGRNRTTFKKGQLPHNHKPVGHEYKTVDGYIMIKTAEPKTFELKHRYVWQQEHGVIPKGHVIRFLDSDRSNCDIDNLICVPMAVNGKVNHHDARFADDVDINKAVLLTETINYHVDKRQQGRSNQ